MNNISRIIGSSINLPQLLLIGVLLFFLLTPFNGAQRLVLPLLIFSSFVLMMWKGSTLIMDRYTILLFGFVLWQFLSMSWAQNFALSWSPIFIWVTMFMLVPGIRWIWKLNQIQKSLPYVLCAVLAITLIHQLFAVHYEIPYDQVDWNKFLFKNRYYTTCYLISLFPFLLFAPLKHRFSRFLKLIFGILIASIILITHANGAAITFFFLWFYFFLNREIQIRASLKSILLIGTIVVCLLGVTFFNTWAKMGYGLNKHRELTLIERSSEIIKEKPFTGVGVGNWIINAYPDMINSEQRRLPNHNLYMGFFAELGVIGFLLLIGVLCWPLIQALRYEGINWLVHAAGGSLLVYIVSSFFYRDVNSHVQHFSAIQFLAFMSMGIILHETIGRYIRGNRIGSVLGVLLALLCNVWFVYERGAFRNGSDILRMEENGVENVELIRKIESIYNPTFLTHHGNMISYDALLMKCYLEEDRNIINHEISDRLKRTDPHHSILTFVDE